MFILAWSYPTGSFFIIIIHRLYYNLLSFSLLFPIPLFLDTLHCIQETGNSDFQSSNSKE